MPKNDRTKLVLDVLEEGPVSRQKLIDRVAPLIAPDYAWRCYLVDNKHPLTWTRSAEGTQHAQTHVVTKVLRELRHSRRITEDDGLISLVR